MLRRLTLILAILTLATSAYADTPGIDLTPGEYYAIDSCRQVTGTCEWTQLGNTEQGSLYFDAGAGETITTRIDGMPLLYVERAGSTWQDGITSTWGRLVVYGSISHHVARRVSAETWPDVTDVTILADTSAGDVVVHVPQAQYHPGRRLTIEKVGGEHAVRLVCESGGTINGQPTRSLTTLWQHVTIEAAPQGDYVAGFTSDEWFVVGGL